MDDLDNNSGTVINFNDFSHICRICLQAGNLTFLSDIKTNLFSTFKTILGLEVQSHDECELPRSICNCCIEAIANIFNFIESYKTNTKLLYDVLSRRDDICNKRDIDSDFDDIGYPLSCDESDNIQSKNESSQNISLKISEDEMLNETDFNEESRKSKRQLSSHTCETCGKVFSRSSGLQRHIKIHLGIKPFKCTTCGKTFVEKATLSRHSLIHSGEKPFGCNLCGKFARRRDQIFEHVTKHHPNVKDADFVIYENQATKESFLETEDKLTNETEERSKENNTNIEAEESVKKEFKTKKRVEICQCTLCGKVFQRRGYLKNHMAIHAEVKPYQCEICSKGFTQRHALIRHSLVHTKERPFQCNLCGKTFTRKEILTEHIKNHDGNKRYLCFHCGKCFENKYYLAKHLKYYLSGNKNQKSSEDKKCICPRCGKQLHSVSYLKVHLLTHSGEKPYECDICGNKFTIYRSLKHHLNIHKGIKPYQCKNCDKSFRTSGSLKKHQFLHTGERPYKCTSCNKGFIRRSHLKRHFRTH